MEMAGLLMDVKDSYVDEVRFLSSGGFQVFNVLKPEKSNTFKGRKDSAE